MSVFLTCN